LQEVIADYPGTVILISHDRDFLDRTVTLTVAWEGEGAWHVYGGGYSDMVAQRGRPAEEEGAAPAGRKAGGGGRQAPQRSKKPASKLSFNESHALKTLPQRIAGLEAEIVRLKGVLSDGGLYNRDATAFKATADRLDTAQAALKHAEDEWLALEMKRESIERG